LNWREGRWEDSENKIVNNLVMNNGAGIVLRFANRNKIHANIVTGNEFTGISLSATQNDISGNAALDNAEDMFDNAPDCDDNQWQGNRFETANQPCIQ